MSDTTRYRQPQEVAGRLEVSHSTLRRWSEEFAEFLSPEANSAEGSQQRRYSDGDLATLITVKGLMAEGLTFDQVSERLCLWHRR
jgi:DNA-binding transcriptional MerR regulator